VSGSWKCASRATRRHQGRHTAGSNGTLDGQFLVQRTEVPVPEAPDSLASVGAELETGGYIQHYYDSRGVARLYAMSLADGVWTLTREAADFSPLDFRQRFTGTFSPNAGAGRWGGPVRLPGGEG
jgi:hypothetical protein